MKLSFSKETAGETANTKTEAARGYWGFQELTDEELKKIAGAGCGGCGGCGGGAGAGAGDGSGDGSASGDGDGDGDADGDDGDDGEDGEESEENQQLALFDIIVDISRAIQGLINGIVAPPPQPAAPATGPRA